MSGDRPYRSNDDFVGLSARAPGATKSDSIKLCGLLCGLLGRCSGGLDFRSGRGLVRSRRGGCLRGGFRGRRFGRGRLSGSVGSFFLLFPLPLVVTQRRVLYKEDHAAVSGAVLVGVVGYQRVKLDRKSTR